MADSNAEIDAYLKKNLEPAAPNQIPDELKKVLDQLNRPIEDVDLYNQAEVSLKQGDITLQFSHEPFYKSGDYHTAWQQMSQYRFEPDYMSILKNFSLTNDKNGAHLVLSDILPGDYTVIFDMWYYQPLSSFMSIDPRLIVITEPLTIPHAVFSLLHEVGHVEDFKRRPETVEALIDVNDAIGDVDKRKINKSEAAEFLRAERNASAYALIKLRPFMSEAGLFSEEGLRYFVHHSSMHAHSEAVRSKLA